MYRDANGKAAKVSGTQRKIFTRGKTGSASRPAETGATIPKAITNRVSGIKREASGIMRRLRKKPARLIW